MLPKTKIGEDIAIQVNGISKAYRIGLEEVKHDTLGSAIISFFKRPIGNLKRLRGLSKFNKFETSDIYWANKDISFVVKKGEVLGIIGKNGAGKSTLLKILSKITDPTEGQIIIKGKVASLLEVGTGFNPELTGRENVYLNGTILGMTKKEIDLKFNEIVEFSGIPKFIDTPVKRYSSGMKVRLAFAVAAFLEPDILIIDEVLAVGDAEFQKKCLGKMKDISGNNGRTVLFVSHDLAAVRNLCNRAVLLSQGNLILDSTPEIVIDKYLTLGNIKTNGIKLNLDIAKGDKRFVINEVALFNSNNDPIPLALTGQDVKIQLKYSTESLGPDPIVILKFRDNMDKLLFTCLSRNSFKGTMALNEGVGKIFCIIPKLPILPGVYKIDITLKYGHELTFDLENCFDFQVEKGDFFNTGRLNADMINGIIVYHQWELR
jgi:lipopolysaccharide transport system ATP-binding protein